MTSTLGQTEFPLLGGAKFMDGTGLGLMTLDGPATKPPDLNRGEMSATCCFASTVQDRVGDIFEVGGIETDEHQLYPVVLLDHGRYYRLPLGLTKTRPWQVGDYTVKINVQAGEAWQTTYFSQRSAVAEQIYALVDEGAMAGNSIGFGIIEQVPLGPAPILEDGKRGKPPMHIRRSKLREITWTSLPVNPETVRRALDRDQICGKSLLAEVKEALTPYAAPHKVWSNGILLNKPEGKSMTETEHGQPVASGVPPEENLRETHEEPPKKEDEEPPSAHAHRMIYEHTKSLHTAHMGKMEEMKRHVDKLEHEQAKSYLGKHMDGVAGDLDKHLARQEEQFEKHHPNLPPLAKDGDGHKKESEVEEGGKKEEKKEEKKDEKRQKEEGKVPAKKEKSLEDGDTVTKAEPMSAVSETHGGALVKPAGNPSHPHMMKASHFLMDLGHETRHPNLDHVQKAGALYHGEKLKSLCVTEGESHTGNEHTTVAVPRHTEPVKKSQEVAVVPPVSTTTVTKSEEAKEEDPFLAEVAKGFNEALTNLAGGLTDLEKETNKAKRRMRQNGIAVG